MSNTNKRLNFIHVLSIFHKNLKAHDMGFVLLNFSSKELSDIKHLKFAQMLTW